ncbi:MAG: DUF4331 family protein [Deltaproteobacteria bacterium]|nr:DUF4331 family protein [Deltaproteobacteria bacterium]
MKVTKLLAAGSVLALAVMAGSSHLVEASDHDDGEIDLKGRALNLTDHYAFKTGTELSLLMYVNPRSLPQRQYYLSENARYEFHVTKVANRLAASNTAEDFIFRVEAGAATAAGTQPITLTVLSGGTTVVGTHTGVSTSFAGSEGNSALVVNTTTIGTFTGIRYFVGMRSDGFHFDVKRFFQVRDFLAQRFFGGAGGVGNAAPSVYPGPNCEGDAFLGGIVAAGGTPELDGDEVNLWNPRNCAPDFTKNHNITSIAINIPIAALGGTIFDTWSTISVKEVK